MPECDWWWKVGRHTHVCDEACRQEKLTEADRRDSTDPLAAIVERVKLANPTYMSEQRKLVDEIERLRAELRIANEQIRQLCAESASQIDEIRSLTERLRKEKGANAENSDIIHRLGGFSDV